MIEKKEITQIGKFRKTHALKGELNATLDVDTDFLSPGDPIIVELDGIYIPFYVKSIRPKGAFGVLIRIDNVETEECARKFVNKDIYAQKDKVRKFEAGEDDDAEGFYADDLVGFYVYDESGAILGKIESVDTSTANVLLEIRAKDDSSIMLPLADDLIIDLRQEDNAIVMDIPEGILNLN